MTTVQRPAAAMTSGHGRRVAIFAGSLALLVIVAVVSVGIGSHAVALDEVVRALVAYNGSNDHVVVWNIRAPRAVLAIAVGAALGTAGTLIQTMSRNPLAEPGVLGITSGAGFAIILGSAFGVAASQTGQLVLAMVGSVLAALFVYSVGRVSPLRLVLTGVALTAVLNGLMLGMRLMLPDVFDHYRFWAVGSLAGREQSPLTVPLVAIGLALVGVALLGRSLGAIALGDSVAHTLGTNVVRVRVLVLLLVTVLAGAATAVAGPIIFVGLVIPHLARRLAAGSVPWLLAYTMVLGPVLVLVADIGSRVLLTTGEVPVAVVTSFIGGPVLIWVVRRYGAAAL